MSHKWKPILIFVALVVAASLISLWLTFFRDRPGVQPDFRAAVGIAAQDFELPALRGGYIKLSGYRGKVIFLNFWATWCPPCREEMPFMEALYRRLKGREFEMLAVSVDREGEKMVSPFAEKYGLTFSVLLDPDSKTYRLYGLTGVPETFIVDKNGVIVRKIIGPQNWMGKEWLDYFDRTIGQQQG